MEVETQEVDEGTRITLNTDSEVAVAVYSGGEERIYLPEGEGSDSSYYVEEVERLVETENGYKLVHPGEIDDFKFLG